jgi:magnesium transporter
MAIPVCCASVLRVLDLPSDGPPRAQADASAEAIAPPPAGVLRWIDLVEPDAALLEVLRERFGFDSLAIKDCAEYGRRSKVDDYDRYSFIVIHAFTEAPDDPLDVRIHEIHAFLSDSYLVTVHDNPIPAQEAVWERASRDPSVLTRGPSWALYLAAEAMVGAAMPLVDAMADQLDDLERAVIEDGLGVDLPRLFTIKRTAVAMRRVLRPLRDTIGLLSRRTDDRISMRTGHYLRDLGDHVQRLVELAEETREVALSTIGAYQTLQVQRTNDVMKKLTVFSAVFLPLGVIVGFWGQNFHGLPYDSGWALAFMLATLVAVPAGLMEWFRRHWL